MIADAARSGTLKHGEQWLHVRFLSDHRVHQGTVRVAVDPQAARSRGSLGLRCPFLTRLLLCLGSAASLGL